MKFGNNHQLYESRPLYLINRNLKVLVKEICSDGHFQGVKGVLERVIRVQLVDLVQ